MADCSLEPLKIGNNLNIQEEEGGHVNCATPIPGDLRQTKVRWLKHWGKITQVMLIGKKKKQEANCMYNINYYGLTFKTTGLEV